MIKKWLLLPICLSIILAACTPAATPSPVINAPAATMAATPAQQPAPRAITPASTKSAPSAVQAIIADHTADADRIPEEWLARARENVVWAYGSTSHGTQLWTGAVWLSDNVAPPTYHFAMDWRTPPEQSQPPALRMGYDDGWSWEPDDFLEMARDLLVEAPEANAFMWSWCGQMSDPDTDVGRYLRMMAQLEEEFPDVRFVYMTGHTDGGGAALKRNNDLVRRYVQEHNKILYDFADIESYDPDGNYYPDTDDSCPWCYDWCDQHPGDCKNLPEEEDECAHSHGFNCVLKGRALWWLSARLAGWNQQ
jgi:hypothetical protein